MAPAGPGHALGPKSARLQHLRRLSGRRRARREAGQFVVDGPKLVAEAIGAGADVVEVYAEPGADLEVVDAARDAGIAVVAVDDGALAKVTSPVTPQALAALVGIPPAPTGPPGGLVLVLVGLGDPGNAGTLVRTAEAAGASAVVSCGDGVDPWNPKCVRASAGSILRVPILEAGSTDACLDLLRAAGMKTVALDMEGRPVDAADLLGDVALLLGNEAHGLDDAVRAAADEVVAIPMLGAVESLNVAMAGTVLAFESARQRRLAATGGSPSST